MANIEILTMENCPLCKKLCGNLDKAGIVYKKTQIDPYDIEGMALIQYYGLADVTMPVAIIDEVPYKQPISELYDMIIKL